MGFKRTSEGRVFFQGSTENANDEQGQGNAQPGGLEDQPRALQSGSPQTQIQILALLKALNERLKITQAERNRMRMELDAYRSIIEDLETKSEKTDSAYEAIEEKLSTTGGADESRVEQAEKIARETMQELSETRKLLLEIEGKADRADRNLASLISVQKDHAQKMTGAATGYKMLAERLDQAEAKQEDIGGKVETAISEQARLVRKVDKAIDERTRFMRKIERIEETVIQMRDTLNARAMVLLTDQNPNVQTINEDPGIITDGRTAQSSVFAQQAAAQTLPFWKRKFEMQAAGLIPLAAVLVLAGWLITQGQKNESGSGVSIERTVMNQLGIEQSPGVAPAPDFAPTAEEQDEVAVAELESTAQSEALTTDWSVTEDTQAFSEAPAETEMAEEAAVPEAAAEAGPAPVIDTIDDIGAVDLQNNEQVLALLESDPDALAAQLNAIEPGSTKPTEQIELAQAQAAPAAATPAVPRTPAPPIGAPTKKAKPLTSAKPDSKLPESIRGIEAQAFQGAPEAQHDLAAIYTAGHGGAPQSYEKAAFWFRQAADNGVANARYNLGVLYHQGLGLEQDTAEAIRWYKSASDLNHPEAQYNLGIAYIEGIGVPYDPVKATEYFETAANAGVMESAYNLGLIYENGLLGQAKPDVALMWYKTAADRGSPEAKAALEQLAKTLKISLQDVNRVVEEMQAGNKKGAAATPAVPTAAKKEKLSAVTPAPVPPQTAPAAVTDVVASAPPPAATNDIFTRNSQEQMVVAQVQEYLMRIGLYPGPADGMKGPLTQDAVRSYQALNNMNVDGVITQDLLTHMLANAGTSASTAGSSAFENLN